MYFLAAFFPLTVTLVYCNIIYILTSVLILKSCQKFVNKSTIYTECLCSFQLVILLEEVNSSGAVEKYLSYSNHCYTPHKDSLADILLSYIYF